MGADVIKFEAPAGDNLQRVAPTQRGLGCMYAHSNLGKRSVVLDFKQPEDRDRAKVVLERADVFVQSMRPGVAARLGFGPDQVRTVNPTIVYVDSSAWGQSGPMGRDSGADPPVQAFSGFTSLNGSPDGPGEFHRCPRVHGLHQQPGRHPVGARWSAAPAAHRPRPVRGGHHAGASLLAQRTRIAEFFATGQVPPRRGSAAHSSYRIRRSCALTIRTLSSPRDTDEQWRRLTAARAESLAGDDRLATNPGRLRHRREVVTALESIFAIRPVRWWEVLLARHAVPVARPLDYHGVVEHPQVRANRMIVTLDTEQAGAMDFASHPWLFDGEALPMLGLASPGVDTEQVLVEFAATPRWCQRGARRRRRAPDPRGSSSGRPHRRRLRTPGRRGAGGDGRGRDQGRTARRRSGCALGPARSAGSGACLPGPESRQDHRTTQSRWGRRAIRADGAHRRG